MGVTKLTLSANPALIETAKRLAAESGTSVSAMFARLIAAVQSVRETNPSKLGPVTTQVPGLVSLPEGKSDAERLEDALSEARGRTG